MRRCRKGGSYVNRVSETFKIMLLPPSPTTDNHDRGHTRSYFPHQSQHPHHRRQKYRTNSSSIIARSGAVGAPGANISDVADASGVLPCHPWPMRATFMAVSITSPVISACSRNCRGSMSFAMLLGCDHSSLFLWRCSCRTKQAPGRVTRTLAPGVI